MHEISHQESRGLVRSHQGVASVDLTTGLESDASRRLTHSLPGFLLKHLLIVSVFAALLKILAGEAASHSPYSYDEADYMYATKLGLSVNYTDTPTMPFVEFLQTGLSHRPLPPTKLSALIRGSNDIVFYRHWHGPLYFYSLMLISQFNLDEYRMRLFNVAFAVVSLVVIYVGVSWVLGSTQGTLAAILASALFVWSAAAVRSVELAPHQAFVSCSLASLFLLSKTATTGNRLYFYWAMAVAALSCCLLEVGFVVVATCGVCAYVERRNLHTGWKLAMRSLLVFLSTISVVWPGSIMKLSLVKGYLFMAYLALFRKSPWGAQGFMETWERRFLSSPLEWLVIGVSLFTWTILRRPESNRRVLYPFFWYAAMMLVTTMRVTTGSPRYSLLFEPALDVLAGCILAAYLTGLRRPITAYAVAIILSLALFAETWINLQRQPVRPDTRLSSLLVYIRENRLESSRLLVPQTDLPTLHYYFPNSHLLGYTDSEAELPAAQDSSADGLLYPGLPIRYESFSSREIN